jgi:hypothetical protein
LVLAAVVALALAGVASAARLDGADHGGDPSRRSLREPPKYPVPVTRRAAARQP